MTRRLPAGTSVLLVAVALAFVPLPNLPSFDAPKLALLSAGAAMLAFAAARRRDPAAPETSLRDPLLLLPLVLALAAAVAALGAWPRGSLLGPALTVVCVVAARLVPAGPDGVRSTLRAASIASAAAGVYALAQAAGLDPAPWGARREVVSTFGNTSFAAEFQAAALPCAVVLGLRPASRADRALGWAAAALAVAHLALAKSRIDLVSASVAVGVVAVAAVPDRRVARAMTVGGLAVATVVAGLFVLAARGQVGFLGRSDTLRVRTEVWDGALRCFADAPLRFGTAPFVDLFPPFRSPDEYRISLGRVVDTPHMDLLEIATTLGLVGVAAALAWSALAAFRLVRMRDSHPWETAALGGAAAAIVVSGLASSPLTHPATALLLALAVGHLVRLAPRAAVPLPVRARTADFAAWILALLAFWPGPGLQRFRSDAFYALGRSERDADRTGSALPLLDTACAADPLAFLPRYEIGTALLAGGEPAAAAEALRSALAIRPHATDAQVNLVHALRAAGRGDEADRTLAAALRDVPWDPLLLTARSARFAAQGDTASALADAVIAMSNRPWDLRVEAVACDARLRSAVASDVFGEMQSGWARDAALRLLERAWQARDFRVLEDASRAFARSDPMFLAALTAKARRIAADSPDVAAALVLAPTEARRLTPGDPGFFDEAARVLRETGRDDAARVFTGRAMGLRARQALAAGDPDGGKRLAVRAAERDPIPDHHVTEALCLARTAGREAVREALSAALALGPVDADLLRSDPAFAALLPDPAIETLLSRGLQRDAGR